MQSGYLNTNVFVHKNEIDGFENLYNDVINILEENNYNNDYLQNNIDNVNEKILNNNDFISETYYVFLIIFLLFIVYKITNKK